MEKHILIVNEKPSVSQDFKRALQVQSKEKTDGYIEGYSQVLNCTVRITWCVGHLCELSYPEAYGDEYKKWNLDTLPFLPQQYKYNVKKATKKQFDIVKKLYHSDGLDTLYFAGDAGREGLYIQALVRQLAGTKTGVLEKVVWIDSYTDREILRGIKEAKDYITYEHKKDAAYMRAIEDYATGINFSRALSCKYGRDFNNKIASTSWKPIAVGRVMSCVLGMIVEREREIRNFVETPFFRILGDTGFTSDWKAVEGSAYYESVFLYNESGFKEKDKAELLLKTLQKDGHLEVESIKSSTERKGAPLLFNLAEIQYFCSKKYKISPDETLAIIQSLYEKKLVTYPRTDARVLSSAVASEIAINLNGLSKLGYKRDCIMEIAKNQWNKKLLNSPYVDDSKITDHYAIIPTGAIDGVAELKEVELNIYHDIIDRFLCIFYPPAEFTKVEAVLVHVMGEKFFASKKLLKEYGYMDVLDDKPQKEDSPICAITKGQILDATFEIKEGKTTPPKRYSSGSIILAMENAGKMIEDETLREQIKGSGIGTSATRAEIIKKLIGNEYIALNKKTQILTPTAVGECIYDIVYDTMPMLLKPDMTASWERGLEGIENGTVTFAQYRAKMEQYVRTEVENVKNKENISYTSDYGVKGKSDESGGILICPVCKKGQMRENKKAYGCTEYKNGCSFSVWKQISGKILTKNQIEKLIKDGKTGIIKGFKSKAGKEFDAKLVINEGKVEFEFSKPEKGSK